MSILFKENFKNWKEGFLPSNQNYYALGECHCFDYPDLKGWICPVNHWSWKGWGASRWKITEERNKRYLEQTLNSLHDNMIMVKYNLEIKNFIYEVRIIPEYEEIKEIGIIFGYTDSANYYAFLLDFGMCKLVKREDNIWYVISQAPFKAKKNKSYKVKLEVLNSNIFCYIGRRAVIKIKGISLRNGKIGLIANTPAKFGDILVKDKFHSGNLKLDIIKNKFKKDISKPLLWKIIHIKGFGTGNNFRYGDLNNDGRLEILLPQVSWVNRMKGFAGIHCLTAIDLEGKILWQYGVPLKTPELVTSSIPCQIYDIDGDGKQEVIFSKDFEPIILEGETGKIKKKADTPKPYKLTRTENELLKHYGAPTGEEFDRVSLISLFICNLSGFKHPSDIIIKDFYHNIWTFNNNLEFQWHYVSNIGHTPAFYDFDGNGREYIMAGYSLLTPDGKLIQHFDVAEHADGIAIGHFDGNNVNKEPTIAIVAGGSGFILADRRGRFKINRIEHAQHLNIANYRDDLPGLEFCVVTFHENPGIMYMWDTTGKLLWRKEMLIAGCTGEPVNWDGFGEELIFYSAHPEYGGLINGFGDIVINFPNDKHPYLCGSALDLTGDKRDEIILWDLERIFIYTQDKRFKGNKIYSPQRLPPIYNYSNYNAIISLPNSTIVY